MLIYLITDRRSRPDLDLARLVRLAAKSGADMLQLREKDLDAATLLDCARAAVRAAGAAGPEVYVNGRPDIALASGARGVHLPADGLPADRVKALWGDRLRVGLSTHAAGGAGGADFLVCGPVFDTPSKRAYGPPLGIEGLRSIVASSDKPVFAIGGINRATIARLSGIRIAGVAVISAVLGADDMARAVSELRGEAA